MLGSRLVALALVGLVPAAASAAALCQKKSGAVVIRPDACRKKETAVDLSQFGATGPKGDKGDPGDPGPAGGARLRAHVDSDPVEFVFKDGFATVTNPEKGTYCLTPSTPIDTAQNPAVVSVDWSHSSGSNLLAQVVFPVYSCSEGDYEVKTFLDDGSASGDVSFVLVVP
jgi:hypothetical protein